MANSNIKKDTDVIKIIHDLKTPIIAQITALESFLATASNKISQEEKDLIELTLNSCNYMRKLIDVFNSVYKLSFENLKLHYEKFNITELVDESLKELGILIKYYELNISFKNHKEIIVSADKLQMKRVIENLLSMSINYAFKNSQIQISQRILNNNLIFEIKNKSPYIEPQILKEIFQKYKSHITLYNKNAAALALYLSKEIVKAHLGLIIAQSNPDNTNIFGFQIPLN